LIKAKKENELTDEIFYAYLDVILRGKNKAQESIDYIYKELKAKELGTRTAIPSANK
jgi:hypothetical protein